MSWKHGQSIEDMLREEMGHDSVPRQVGAVEDRHGPSEAPPLFGAHPNEQITSSFPSSLYNNSHEPLRVHAELNRVASPLPVAANRDHVLGHMDEPPQEACPGGDPVVLPNGNSSQPSAASSPERYHAKNRETKRGHSTLPSRARRGERELSVEAGPAPEISRTDLGPVRPSKFPDPAEGTGLPPDDDQTALERLRYKRRFLYQISLPPPLWILLYSLEGVDVCRRPSAKRTQTPPSEESVVAVQSLRSLME
ncbi:hypothetical protein J3458_021085 [Metarhizium acridum]|uniref:uncharacterized protein n=1 Tax=Metarhizium acridum TaxID=92637 RepID=UPI001C6B6DC7|nr:hypothetical protein J3458_021085 [Metarhizium acridum]